MKRIFFVSAFFITAFFSTGVAFAGGYAIDSVLDRNTNQEWTGSTPTLQQGQTYDVRITGSSWTMDPSFFLVEPNVRLGLFMDFNGTRLSSEWPLFTDPAVISGAAAGDFILVPGQPFSVTEGTYLLDGSFTVPGTTAAQGSAFAFLAFDETVDPTAAQAYGVGAAGYFDVNFGPSQTMVPEPATLVLFGFGVAGAFVSRKIFPRG